MCIMGMMRVTFRTPILPNGLVTLMKCQRVKITITRKTTVTWTVFKIRPDSFLRQFSGYESDNLEDPEEEDDEASGDAHLQEGNGNVYVSLVKRFPGMFRETRDSRH